MTALTKSFISVILQVGLVAVVVCTMAANAQDKKSCGGFDYVGVVADNPFSAERVTTEFGIGQDAMEKPSPIRELVARDEAGRIRFEKRATLPGHDSKPRTLTNGEGESFQVTQEEMHTHILIFDCAAGKVTQIEPGTRLVLIKRPWEPKQVPSTTSVREFSLGLPPAGKTSPELVLEDLGYREIQGIRSRGERRTTMGTDKDGEWNGKPVRVWEQWVSEDLGAILMIIDKDFTKGRGNRRELTHINRDRSNPALFEIPAGYKVNPKPDEFPAMFPPQNE